MNASKKRVVIVGGVAGGANVAARLRRLDEECEITVHERGGYVSFANCGLPYHIGGEIERREKLLVHTPETLRSRFSIDVRVFSEVVAIDRALKEITVRDVQSGDEFKQPYDVLVLSPGATPFRPALPGIDLPDVFSLRDIHDMDRIVARLNDSAPRRALVVGGGFIGLEMVEQLQRKLEATGIHITLVESNPQVLAPLDPEMAQTIAEELQKHGIEVVLADPVVAFESTANGVVASTRSGNRYEADFVLFNIGVRPETKLARDAGLTLGEKGGIQVDSTLRTSDPDIFALGDCIETKHIVTGELGVIPLAGPANRQGRIVADVIAGRESHYKGTLGTAIVRVFSLTAAITGANEKTLARLGRTYEVMYLHPGSHAGYYPGAHPIHLKVIFDPNTGQLLGAQGIGVDGVDKRIDVIATAISAGLSIDDLADLELCYAPPFGSAKDPVNMAGMIGQNMRSGLVRSISPASLERATSGSILLDVRDDRERANGGIPGSVHIPLIELRSRLGELPTGAPIVVYCQSGQRAYNACRILSQHGFECTNLAGAYDTWRAFSSLQSR